MPPAGHSAVAAATPPPTAAAAAATTTPEAPAEGGPAAGGWAAMYGAEDDGGAGGGAAAAEWDVSPAPAAKAEDGGSEGGAGGGLPLDAEGSLPFFFLDAFENMDGRPGEGGVGLGRPAGLVRAGGEGGSPRPTRPHRRMAAMWIKCGNAELEALSSPLPATPSPPPSQARSSCLARCMQSPCRLRRPALPTRAAGRPPPPLLRA